MIETRFVVRHITATLAVVVGASAITRAEETSVPKKSEPYPIVDTKSVYTFSPVASADEWARRRTYIRHHVLISAGLWPMPPKCPLNPQRLDAKTFDGFVREKVYFWSFPGLLVTGALYTPTNAQGRLPAVLSPHGHWPKGRLDDAPQARCINLARQGYVVLAIDMIGYNDSGPIKHDFPGDPLWGLSLGGLQLWNCIRSLDFLETLENVDPKRIGVTGASGGGTQTFMLCAVDDRPAAAAPVCMISAHFQGGCLCENAPLMRVVMNNMEIGATMAPRPLVMVSATGDWTKDTPKVEYPAIRRIYELLGAPDRIAEKQFNLGHNYAQPGREVVYSWFARWLKGAPADTKVAELPYTLDNDLLIFGKDRERPKEAKTPEQFIEYWRGMAGRQLKKLSPQDATGLKRFRAVFGEELSHTLCIEPCRDHMLVEKGKSSSEQGPTVCDLTLGLKGRGLWLPARLWTPNGQTASPKGVLLVHPQGLAGIPESVVRDLVKKGRVVLVIHPLPMDQRKPTKDKFYYTYNRSNLAIRVQEILMGLTALAGQSEVQQVNLVGLDQAGLWALFARALSDVPKPGATLIDACQFNGTSAEAWQNNEMFNPNILRVGGTTTAGTLIAPAALTIHNTGQKFQTAGIKAAYAAAKAAEKLRFVNEKMADQAVADWVLAQ